MPVKVQSVLLLISFKSSWKCFQTKISSVLCGDKQECHYSSVIKIKTERWVSCSFQTNETLQIRMSLLVFKDRLYTYHAGWLWVKCFSERSILIWSFSSSYRKKLQNLAGKTTSALSLLHTQPSAWLKSWRRQFHICMRILGNIVLANR